MTTQVGFFLQTEVGSLFHNFFPNFCPKFYINLENSIIYENFGINYKEKSFMKEVPGFSNSNSMFQYYFIQKQFSDKYCCIEYLICFEINNSGKLMLPGRWKRITVVFLMGQSRPLFCLFLNDTIQIWEIEKSVDGVHGTWAQSGQNGRGIPKVAKFII